MADDLPDLFLYWHELMSMPDYSCSTPSGTTVGKVWRRHEPYNGFHDSRPVQHYVGMYAPSANPKYVRIIWFRVVLKHGPAPRNYRPPDWSNHQKWQRDREQERKEEPRGR